VSQRYGAVRQWLRVVPPSVLRGRTDAARLYADVRTLLAYVPRPTSLEFREIGTALTAAVADEVVRAGSALASLSFDRTCVSDAAAEIFARCGTNTRLSFAGHVRDQHGSHAIVSGRGAIALVTCGAQLTHFNVSVTNDSITDATLWVLSQHCPQLQHLVAGRVTDQGLIAVAHRCPGLTHLDVASIGGAVTDKALQEVARHCPKLQFLNATNNTGVSDLSIAEIARCCSQLQHLLVSVWQVSDECIVCVAAHCPQLRTLKLSCTGEPITDRAISEVASHCPMLECLFLPRNDFVTSGSIKAIARNCPMLRELYLSVLRDRETDEVLLAVAQHCPKLQYLNVAHTGVSDTSVIVLAQRCPLLRHLVVADVRGGVTDEGVHAVALNCPRLQYLDISGAAVTEASLVQLALRCPDLRSVSVYSTEGAVTKNVVAAMRQWCPDAELFHDDAALER